MIGHLPEHQLGQDPAGEGVEQADQQRGQGVVLGEPWAACTVYIAFNSGLLRKCRVHYEEFTILQAFFRFGDDRMFKLYLSLCLSFTIINSIM